MGLTATGRGRLSVIFVVVALITAVLVGLNWWDGSRAADDAEKAEAEAAAVLRDLGAEGYTAIVTTEGPNLEHASYFGGDRNEGGGYTMVWQVRTVTATRCVIGTHRADGSVSTRVVSGSGNGCDGVLGDRPSEESPGPGTARG